MHFTPNDHACIDSMFSNANMKDIIGKALPPVLYGKQSTRLSIGAKCQVLFMYSTWQGTAVSAINTIFICHCCHPVLPIFRKSDQIRMNLLFSNVCCLLHCCTG